LEKLLETYTSILGLKFGTYTVIKEKLINYKDTGYQPLTLIGGHIYLHCRENHIPISMKKLPRNLESALFQYKDSSRRMFRRDFDVQRGEE